MSGSKTTTEEVPEYPNLHAAFKSAPVVTTLLVGVAAGLLVVPIATDNFRSADLIPWDGLWLSRDAVLVLSFVAIVAFVASTLAMVHAEATDVDALSPEQISVLFEGLVGEKTAKQTKRKTHLDGFRSNATKRYIRGVRLWQVGIALFLLDFGALVSGYVEELALAAGIAALLPLVPLVKKSSVAWWIPAAVLFVVVGVFLAAVVSSI